MAIPEMSIEEIQPFTISMALEENHRIECKTGTQLDKFESTCNDVNVFQHYILRSGPKYDPLEPVINCMWSNKVAKDFLSTGGVRLP